MSDETLCGDGADARYCPVFWSKSAECDELRTLARNILAFAIGTTVFDRTPEQQALIDEWTAVLDPPALDRPVLLTLVITDGEASDWDAFSKVLEQASSTRKFCVAIVGHGPDHDRTLAAYKAVEARNGKHVRVVTFGGETDPSAIAQDLILLVG